MKKIFITVVASLICITGYSQLGLNIQKIKYNVKTPKGETVIVVTNDITEDFLTINTSNDFYRVNIVNIRTNKIVYSSNNTGNSCHITKAHIRPNVYYLHLHTNDFLMKTKIRISPTKKLNVKQKERHILI
jgi:hypothetical protein